MTRIASLGVKKKIESVIRSVCSRLTFPTRRTMLEKNLLT